MRISEATIQELKQILREDYGKDVTQAEASEIASTLVGYFYLLAKIYHRNSHKNNNSENMFSSVLNKVEQKKKNQHSMADSADQ